MHAVGDELQRRRGRGESESGRSAGGSLTPPVDRGGPRALARRPELALAGRTARKPRSRSAEGSALAPPAGQIAS